MMYSGKKFLLFSLLGILLGYLFHRLTLLYDSYTGNSLDKWTHLLMEGQDEVLQSPWNVSFTGKSSAFFLLGFVMMLLVYLYLETGKKQYREGVEYGSARFGTLKEKKLFYGKECYPFWDKNSIYASLDGSMVHFSEDRIWWPYWRTTFWATLAKGVSLSAGEHTLTISVGVNGVQFYGFRVCTDFSEEPTAGQAEYTLAPRKFKDVNGDMVGPATGFKLTLEMLRRKPDSALVWYEDFRDEQKIPESYWTVLSGEWDVWQEDLPYGDTSRPYSQLEGYGQLAWNYNGFSDIHLRAQIIFSENGGGKAGVFLGSLFCCFNYDSQCIELYEGSTLKGSYATDFSQTAKADLRTNPNIYTIEMRKRGNKVRVYSSASYTLRFTATVSDISGYAGIRSDNQINCQLLRLGDAWTYEPYERFDVVMPDGTETSFGRIERSNCTWDEEFQVFTLTSDVEESSTRDESISLDYEFYHSHVMALECGNDYTAKIIPRDINIWISRLFLGDADGFSILYYQDVDSLIYWANQAAYRWKLRGMCMWSLGQEDMRVWEWLPKQTE